MDHLAGLPAQLPQVLAQRLVVEPLLGSEVTHTVRDLAGFSEAVILNSFYGCEALYSAAIHKALNKGPREMKAALEGGVT